MAENGAFPEYPLWSHYKRSHDWTPDGLDRLLDAGCAWGYGTRHFHTKARTVVGLDPGADAIAVAQERYPSISFVEGVLESAPFESESFDAVVACNVLEHVGDEGASFDELWRILRPGGVVTMTVPHSGPLSTLTPEEYGGRLAAWAKRFLSRRPAETPVSKGVANTNRYYAISDVRDLLEHSGFRGGYEIRRVARRGFLLELVILNLDFFLRRILRGRALHWMEVAFAKILTREYRIPYGPLANNMTIQFSKGY
jgi:SAM-dependent methyltransferase